MSFPQWGFLGNIISWYFKIYKMKWKSGQFGFFLDNLTDFFKPVILFVSIKFAWMENKILLSSCGTDFESPRFVSAYVWGRTELGGTWPKMCKAVFKFDSEFDRWMRRPLTHTYLRFRLMPADWESSLVITGLFHHSSSAGLKCSPGARLSC